MKNITLFFALILSSALLAQNDFVGTIVKEMTYNNMSPEIKAYAAMLPSKTTISIDHNLSRTVTPNGMGETVVLSDSETGEVISLMNQAGNLIALRSNENDEKEEETPEVELLDETKEIMGHLCKKAIIIADENEVVIYYTDELPELATPSKVLPEIEGFVMEMIINSEGFTVTTTVTEIRKEKIKKIKMQIPAEYTEMTLEEIKAMQQGGGM